MELHRDRAWRRIRTRQAGGDRVAKSTTYKPEKKWKLMYGRRTKCVRAQQLGFDYPIVTTRKLLEQQ